MDPIAATPENRPRQVTRAGSSQEVTRAHRLLILALRYAISPREYAILRRRVLLRGPSAIRSLAPSNKQYDTVCNPPGTDDYIPSATRAGIRVFLLSNVSLNLLEAVAARLSKRGDGRL